MMCKIERFIGVTFAIGRAICPWLEVGNYGRDLVLLGIDHDFELGE